MWGHCHSWQQQMSIAMRRNTEPRLDSYRGGPKCSHNGQLSFDCRNRFGLWSCTEAAQLRPRQRASRHLVKGNGPDGSAKGKR
jgi:hypothetical protein